MTHCCCSFALRTDQTVVVASTLATLHAYGGDLGGEELAEVSRVAEQHIGTIGGGMDQAISVLGRQGQALLIGFDPVRGTPVSLPPSAVFVVAHSLTEENKAATAGVRYNRLCCYPAANT